jgi:phage terminase large subunit-like protein
LKHYKGEWAGKPVILRPFQVFRLCSVFGWVHRSTGLRRFRIAYNELPRKNGKSLEAAIVVLYATFFDGEPGAEGFCLATKREQARIVFNDARALVLSSGLRAVILPLTHTLSNLDTASKLEPISADSKTLDGLNAQVAVTDEFHAHPDRRLVDVVETSMGARRQPIHWQITTAGDSMQSPCGDQHMYAIEVLEQRVTDDTFFAFIAAADEGDDWTDPATWAKANPNFGISLYPDYFRALVTKALAIPGAAAEFKQKHLNQWINAGTPWLSIDHYKKGQTAWSFDDMRGQVCYIGIDLASKLDLMAAAAVFPPTPERRSWRAWVWAWVPDEAIRERARRDRTPYDTWAELGELETVPGPRLSYRPVRALINQIKTTVTIEKIAIDPWHASEITEDLIAIDGFPAESVVEVPQTYAGISAAALECEAAIVEALLDCAGRVVVEMAVGNAVVQRDGKGNLFPVKNRSRGRIDPLMAVIIGIAAALRAPRPTLSVYATRPAFVL